MRSKSVRRFVLKMKTFFFLHRQNFLHEFEIYCTNAKLFYTGKTYCVNAKLFARIKIYCLMQFFLIHSKALFATMLLKIQPTRVTFESYGEFSFLSSRSQSLLCVYVRCKGIAQMVNFCYGKNLKFLKFIV